MAQAATTTTTTTMEPLLEEDLVFLGAEEEEGNNLSFWEFINPSDADSDNESLLSLENGFVSWSSPTSSSSSSTKKSSTTASSPTKSLETNQNQNTHQHQDPLRHANSHVGPIIYAGVVDLYRETQNIHQHQDALNYANSHVGPIIYSRVVDMYHNHDDDDCGVDDDEDDDGYGLDDELVPWHVSGKLGRQRMRKLGKRGFAKMGNSKRNPYLYVKPGCVYGKHGLGMKA